jgi:hypothetical protein
MDYLDEHQLQVIYDFSKKFITVMSDDEQLDYASAIILKQYHKAYEELAK